MIPKFGASRWTCRPATPLVAVLPNPTTPELSSTNYIQWRLILRLSVIRSGFQGIQRGISRSSHPPKRCTHSSPRARRNNAVNLAWGGPDQQTLIIDKDRSSENTQHRDQPSPPGRRHLDRTRQTPKRPRPVPIPTTPRTHLKRAYLDLAKALLVPRRPAIQVSGYSSSRRSSQPSGSATQPSSRRAKP